MGVSSVGQDSVGTDDEAVRRGKVATAFRISGEITLDGSLDEPEWDMADPATDFVQRRPVPGNPSGEPTVVRFLFDSDNLYVGVVCFDSDPSRIVVNELEEDFAYRGSDAFSIGIDSLHDLRSAFVFAVNPGGARADYQANQGRFNLDWDGVWDAAVRINDEGWVAEYEIPFKTLRFSDSDRQAWGINMNRIDLNPNEESDWSPIPIRYNLAWPSEYGTLQGLENIRQGRNLKVTPFVIAGVTQIRPASDLSGDFSTDQEFDGGVDLKYSITSSLTLDATYRTDFAQVEVDQQQVNLTRFSLFFPEKRDFFLENSATFNFGAGSNLVPFFSRRIGLSGSGTPIPIVGGARVTGQLGRFDIGFLEMRTESHDSGPANNYIVGRVKRNLITNSWIGGLVTSRDSTIDGDYNRVYGADVHFQFYNRLEIDSYLLQSETPGLSGDAQARQFEARWRDDELTVTTGYNEIQTNFNPEVGFVRRPNNTRYNGAASWNPLIESSTLFRNLVFGVSLDYYKDGTTDRIVTRDERIDLGLRFENNALIDFSMIQTFDRLRESFSIRPNISIEEGDYTYRGYSARAASPSGSKITANGRMEWGEFWNGHRKSFTGGIGWRPNYHLRLEVDYSRNEVDLPDARFTTDLVGTRFLYAFDGRTFLNAFIQYNADTHQVSSNIRFNIIHRPLSDFFIVYNDLRDTRTGQLTERAVTLKLTNLFNF